MAGEQQERSEEPTGAAESPPQERPEKPRLRRRPLGYKRADVDEALGARDAELAELRQDIAALWLAFAQHDRMLRELGGEPPPAEPPAPDPRPEPAESTAAAESALLDTEAASIGTQLSELDEVLAAIEMATKTLERTYAEEVREPDAPEPPDPAEAEDDAEPAERPEEAAEDEKAEDA